MNADATAKPGTGKKPVARRKPSARRTGGTLMVIAGLLLGSGVIRLGNGIGLALALEAEPAPQTAVAGCAPSGDAGPLLKALQDREARLAIQENAAADRQKALDVAGAEIDRKLAALQQAESELSATLALADTAAEDDLARLTTVYENMKPKDAARMFEKMAPEFAVGFLARMKPEAAANLMAGLSPTTAYAISVLMAGRNALVPKD